MLAADNLACQRGQRTLFSELSFALEPGWLLHVRGANGSGKTSLLRLVAGLTLPAAGQVQWNGHAISADAEGYRGSVLYLGHAPALKDDFSAVENLCLASRLAGEHVDEDIACETLGHWGLKGRTQLPCRSLSQGQRRRVGLARLALTTRRLWLLDEPLASLDAEATALLESLLERHLAQGGLALLTTHQPINTPAARTRELQLGLAPHPQLHPELHPELR